MQPKVKKYVIYILISISLIINFALGFILYSKQPSKLVILDDYYGHTTDGNYIYYLNSPIEKADIKTFEVIGTQYYAKDKNNVYFNGKVLEGIDPSTFTIINEGGYYFKDKNSVYFDNEKIENSDPNTFELIVCEDCAYYAKDKKNFYYRDEVINSVDKDSFTVLSCGGCWDANYSKDKTNVYYESKIVVGADPDTFAYFDLTKYGYDAKDKKNIYRYGAIISEEDAKDYIK